ncbi:MAG: DNA internalization-related competence protein ComEC/Rec2 [Oscillospiraceae bacterium]|nr:DNA internalization-related competence protein ComEC/Rec2 [Oscillospiraceae bacterium]
MRKLMWFTIGFAAACLLCALFWIDAHLMAASVGCLTAWMAALLLGRRYEWLRRVGAVLLGLGIGFGWYDAYASVYLHPALALEGKTAQITAQCADYSYQTNYGTAVDAWVEVDGRTYRARIYVNGQPEMEPGDLVMGEFLFAFTAPGGEKSRSYHQSEGTFLLAYQKNDAKLGKVSHRDWRSYPAVWRGAILSTIEDCFPEDAAAFAKALLLGDRRDIDYETNTAFKVSGISHIVAVSGLHVSILFALVYALGFHNRWLTALLGIPALLLFAAVAGFSPSITRACIMQILMILALCLEKEYDPPTALAFAALVMLAVNPLVILSASFQLSVGCMAGIFLFREPVTAWMRRRVPRWLSDSIAVTLSAMTLTTPLVAWHFGTISLVGALTNLLVLWVVSFIFYGIIAVCLLSLFWTFAAEAVAWVIAWPIRYVLFVSKLLATFPLAAVYTESIYIVLWLVFCCILLLVFLCSFKKNPGTLLCCGVLGLAMALALSWGEPLLDECRVTVLDVGQGQSILLQSGGKAWLVDCGGSNDAEAADKAAETIFSQGVFRLDGIILTHYDRDHAGGIANLLTRIPADVVFLPGVEDTDGVGEPIAALADQTVHVSADIHVAYGDTAMTVFAPALTDSDNESGLCILFSAANCDILVTGDRSGFGEQLLLRRAQLPQLEILIAGHHGAASSTSEELLDATNPAIVAVSAGKNPYGHPAEELLERLTAHGCIVYRTDQDGDIIFRR